MWCEVCGVRCEAEVSKITWKECEHSGESEQGGLEPLIMAPPQAAPADFSHPFQNQTQTLVFVEVSDTCWRSFTEVRRAS